MKFIRIIDVVHVGIAFAIGPAVAGDFWEKSVGTIRGPDGRPCTFFTLNGVPAADPITPNSPWILLRQAAPGYKENLAILMSAKLAGRNVNVSTIGSGVAECGGAIEAQVVMLP